MGDVGKLREYESKLGEETEHLSGDALDVVLAADDDEARDLVADCLPRTSRSGCAFLMGTRPDMSKRLKTPATR
ncbi:MAG: hypothetical protein K2Y71_00790 [Xanthobacteraceae bacterium]|nr:hypothetical protein [Xanthobacteraceae bacterium]